MTLTSCRVGLLASLAVVAVVVGSACAGTVAAESCECSAEDAGAEPRQEAGAAGTTTPPGRVKQLAVDEVGSTCAVLEDGRVFCWGRQIGDSDKLYDPARLPIATQPREIPALAGTTQLRMSKGRACALGQDGRIRCWGRAFSHEFTPWSSTRLEPFDIGAEDAIKLSSNADHACWVRADAKVLCWGLNSALGAYPDIEWDLEHHSMLKTPMVVPGLGPAKDVVASGVTCALLLDETIHCWGGMIALDPTFKDYRPVAVPGLEDIVELGPGGIQAGIKSNGRAFVLGGWGWTLRPDENRASYRAGARVRQVTSPREMTGTLVVMDDGYLDFQFDDPLPGIYEREEHILTGRNYAFDGDVTYAAPAPSYACVLTSDNEVHCVGTNMHGQLGDGTTTHRPRFVPVLWPLPDEP